MPAPSTRRSQADRTRETRARILAAAVRRVAAAGYAAATLQEIANEAEVTKGAIQHHFADKRELDVAIFTHGYRELIDRLGQITAKGGVAARVDAVVDAMHDAYASEAIQAAIEVDRAWRRQPPDATEVAPFYSADLLDEQWRGLFPDAEVSDRRLLQVRRLVRTALQGHLARQATGVSDDAPLELDTVKAAAVLLLTNDDRRRRSRRP